MARSWRSLWTREERLKAGSNDRDNFVVLIASLTLAALVGAGLAYYVYGVERPTTIPGQTTTVPSTGSKQVEK